jgi:protein-S-isoprenylcysteine O-methyltransferase Ste14
MQRLVPLGQVLFRFRGWIFPAILVLALVASRPRHLLGEPAIDAWMDALGVCVALAGLFVRGVTIGYEYIVRGGRNRRVYADDLVQGGIYALTRNPMYVGNALLILGCALIINAPGFYLVALPLTALAYASIVAAEEAYLRKKFGAQFDAYSSRVNRFLPRLAGFRNAIQGMTFNWRRLVVKEYNTFFWGIVQVVVLCSLDDYLIAGGVPIPPYTLAFLGAWIVLYLVVWRLKKSGRLHAAPVQTPADEPHRTS